MDQQTKRRRRSDRAHAIYRLTCIPTGELYIGLTVCSGLSPQRAVEGRWQRHVTRALKQGRDWRLCEAIREHGAQAFTVEVLEKVRGKAEAHRRERELTKLLTATLNTA